VSGPGAGARPPPNRKKRLSTDLIVDTAVAIAADRDTDALTTRRLGAQLGVDPTALYRYVDSLDDLVLLAADRLLRMVVADLPPAADWRAHLGAVGRRLVDVFTRHPAIGAVVASRTTRRPAEFAVVEGLLGAVRAAGLDDEEAVLCYRAFVDFTLAYAGMRAQYVLLGPDVRAADERAWAEVYGRLPADRYPHIAGLAPQLPDVDDDRVLAAGLDLLVDGIAARAARRA
jgi:AcrR family transcriptional regulator